MADDEEVAKRSTCPGCDAEIVVYDDATGLLPDEYVGERRATHHWRACELHALLRAERSRLTFPLDAPERSKSDAWIIEHNKVHAGQGHTAIGGRYTYSFTPTTLGTVAKVTCACGESIDLTNYEEW